VRIVAVRRNAARAVLVALAIVVAPACQQDVRMWAACQPSTTGDPTGTDGAYVLVCKDGLWQPIMTVDEFVRSARGENVTTKPLPVYPSGPVYPTPAPQP